MMGGDIVVMHEGRVLGRGSPQTFTEALAGRSFLAASRTEGRRRLQARLEQAIITALDDVAVLNEDRILLLMDEPLAALDQARKRSLSIGLVALAVAGLTAIAWPSSLDELAGLVWLLALIPAFLFAYYRGWEGAAAGVLIAMILMIAIEIVPALIVGTEVGLLYPLKKANPDKNFYPASEQMLCSDMKKTTLEDIARSLEFMEGEVKVPENIRQSAFKAVQGMVDLSLLQR